MTIINLIVWLILGALVGWLASKVMYTDAQQGALLNIIVGIVGAFIGGLLISPLFGIAPLSTNNFSIAGLLVAFVGALILLAIVNLFTRGRAR